MTISDYIECINKVFTKHFPDKGFFVSTELYEKTPFPIYKKLTVKIMHVPSNEEVYTFTFQDKVPTGKEDKFKDACLLELITLVTDDMKKLWDYGVRV